MLLKKASFYILNGCIKRRFYPNYFWVQKSISPLNFFSTGQVKTMNFNEKAFMMKFLEVTQNRGNFNQEQIQSLMTELNQNLDSISKPNSYAALLHKIQYLHKHANSELINKLVTNSITVFKQNYDCSDNGDLLKAVILVVCLQKINNPSFFKEFSRIVLKNIPKISFFNLLTILESYSYNKWLFKCFSIDESTNLLKSFANKINPTQFSHLPKLCTVLYFIFKNSKYELNSEEAAKIINQVEIIINILYDNLLQMFIQDRATKTMDLFVLTDIIIALNPFNTMSNKLAGKYSLLSKQYDGIVNEYLSRSKGAVIPIKYDLKAVISFVKRYYVTPPQEINPKMSGLINQIFWLHYNDRDFKHLENYVYFILFLLKTDSFNPPKQYSLPLFDLISQEKNLLILAKALEIYVLNEKSGKISFAEKTMELKAIEKIIFDIINRLPKENIVAGPLVQIFQSMVALNIGDLDKWKLLFKLFSEEEIRKLDYVDLIIKLIPAAAIKTKSIYKIYSNISSSGSSQHIKGPRVDPEFAQLLKKFWISIENIIIEKFEDIQFDKLPTILFYLVYANLFDSRYTKIFSLAKQKVEKNIEKFDPKQLVEIAYAYSRVGQKDSDSLFFLISSQILSTNAISQLGPIELSNLYWALSHSRIWNKKFNELAEAKLFSWVPQMTLESLTEFCQGLALQDKRLTESEKKALNLKTKEFLNQTKKDETMAYNIQNFFGIINSFNIMENYNDKELWELFLEMVLDRKEQIEASGLLLHYILLGTNNKVSKI